MFRLISASFCAFFCLQFALSQSNPFNNKVVFTYLNSNKDYVALRNKIAKQFSKVQPGRWGEFVKGVEEDIVTDQKVIAFTFDACGGNKKANAYNVKLIEYLRDEHIPATLFVTGLWIDANFSIFQELATDTLFEIENHGFRHRPCSIDGNSKYGIVGTKTVNDAFDEIEANAEKIRLITGRKPTFYRSATAYIDEASVKMAKMIGTSVISFDILSGDAVPKTPSPVIVKNVLDHLKPGAVVIMHFNHPESKTLDALQKIIPELRKQGYSFTRLQGRKLKSFPNR